MPKSLVSLPWKLSTPCPCQSGKTFTQCCARHYDKLPRASKFSLEREEGSTGVDRNGCYLSGHRNCGTKLSLEHPVSHNILKEIGPVAQRGFKGTDGTVDVIVPPKSAGYKVLCDLHNADLSSLDDHAGRVFRDLRKAVFPIRHPQPEPLEEWVYVDGPKLEAFAIKMLAAQHAAGAMTERLQPATDQADSTKIRRAIMTGEFESGAGLYVCASYASNEIDGLQSRPLSSDGWLVGIHIVMRTFSFIVLFDKERAGTDLVPANATYRPSLHQLYGQGGSAFLFLAWRRKPQFALFSRGRLDPAATGSSSAFPFAPLAGPPRADVRMKLEAGPVEEREDFAPWPIAPVVPPPLPRKGSRFKPMS